MGVALRQGSPILHSRATGWVKPQKLRGDQWDRKADKKNASSVRSDPSLTQGDT